ncbi:MAG: alpha/beta hydrolase [Candidatus Bathyarchaeota archaeon]|nr:alpha/beta hydrolase [Candidatus Bathyarchaeota archaeon]
MSVLTFSYQPQSNQTTVEDQTNLLPEITNCTTQTNVSYSNGSSPYRVMDVYTPTGEGPFPALIYIHGGGWKTGSRTDLNDTATFYAKRGIAGFTIDYTLSTNNKTSWPENIQDVIEAIRYIRQNAQTYNIDTERIGILGVSAGAQLASLSGTLTGDEPFLVGSSGNETIKSQVHIIIDYAGATDLEYVGKHENQTFIDRVIAYSLGNVTYEENPELWHQASPATYVSSGDPIFVIVHGTMDAVIPIQVAESFYNKLTAAGVETYFIKVSAGDHDILTSESENLMVRYQLEPILKQAFDLPEPAS